MVFSLKKVLLCFFCCVLLFSAFLIIRHEEIKANSALIGLTVVIDAGHGGIDGGAVGTKLKVKESDINLAISKKLEAHLKRMGFKVVQTRKTKDGLYSAGASNRKKSDMQKRKEIIESADADLVVSIHQNSFTISSVRGAGVYFSAQSAAGKQAAEKIETEMLKIAEISRVQNKAGDFYILDCSSVPSVLVECAYLTNADDERFIASSKNQERVAYAIFCGIIRYFGVENY